MTLLTTVSTSVAPAAITKVTRLFNGALYDVLNELFQNARRAGATSITLSTERQGAAVRLSVIDDGIGIDEPEALVTLGHSAWDVEIVRREDPAGMGIFSLAGRQVEIRSWSPPHAAGWKLLIEAEDWETSNPVSLASCAIERGTAISFDLPAAWQNELGFAVARAALYFPLPVTLDGEALPPKGLARGHRAYRNHPGLSYRRVQDALAAQTARGSELPRHPCRLPASPRHRMPTGGLLVRAH
jgi:hypothetical protein